MRVLLALLFSVYLAIGAVSPPPTVSRPGTVYIQPNEAAASITNKIGQMPFGWTAEFLPKTDGPYIIPTLTFSLLRSNWNFVIPPGTHLVIGVDSDATERPAFSDSATFAGTAATTNNILAWGATITVSNRACNIFEVTRAGSVVNLYCHDLRRTYTSSGRVCLKQFEGRFSWFITGVMTNGGYDGYWGVPAGTAMWTAGYANRIDVDNTAVEFTTGVYPGHAVITVNHARSAQGNGMTVASNVVVRGGLLEMDSSGAATSAGGDGPAGVLDFREIRGNVQPAELTPLRVVGAKIIGEVITEGLSGEDQVILENVEIESPAGSTYSISALVPPGRATISGGLRVNKPVSADIALHGAAMIGPPMTNAYVGTNVFFSLNGQSEQALVATNAMLLIITNSTAIESGRRVALTIYNNKATNMNVAYSAAGFRPMNQVQNTVTNGRSLLLEVTRIGTNNQIRAFQQQN